MVTGPVVNQVAPGALEEVRELLNSWLIPNDSASRQPVDRYPQFTREKDWTSAQAALVRELRDDVRAAVESRDPKGLTRWISALDIRPAITSSGLCFQHDAGPAGDYLVAVITALSSGQWQRLKACPDCRWVFYDHTRNGSKRWCLMNAGSTDGRACGTIAKVRRYRSRTATG